MQSVGTMPALSKFLKGNRMPADNTSDGQQTTQSYQEKVQEIADRIWKMWEKDLRNERERRGKKGR